MKYPPKPGELRAFMDQHGLSSRVVGQLLQTNPRQVRRWTSPHDPTEMSYTAWHTLVTKVTGRVPRET